MPDIISRTRFIGDASQLLATYRAIGAQGQALQNQLQNATRQVVQNANLDPGRAGTDLTGGVGKLREYGAVIRGLNTEVDALNKTFKISGQTAFRYGTGANGEPLEFLTGTYKTVRGDLDRVTAAATKLNTVMGNIAPIRNHTREILEQAKAWRDTGQAMRYADFGLQPKFGAVGQNLQPLRASSFASYEQIRASAIAQERQQLAGFRSELKSARVELADAFRAAPPFPAAFRQLQQTSPALIKQLQAQGLGTTSTQIYEQGFTSSLDRDLVTGVRKVRGEFTDAAGFTNRFNAELDNAGNVVTRFGRNMSGLQNFLRQTVANFQKVIQWTVATSVVFGTLAAAASELSVLIDVDKTLRQLGITAQLTSEETKGLFGDIADIAIATATPLQEMLKSTDDIALAVRESGKSFQDYRTDILNLTEAVGIYTNLTGQDTVKATDILVASMKQLGLETGDMVGLLSKITAVAGGQSNAIADVATGLGVMAEAARQAGLSIDETIGTVQVLSQVTSKSPAEVATAFKNLVGALDSRAGTKALKEFGIELRDEAGNLRNILEIYGEISDKIRQGVIPEADVKALVKAIAGGPRRAPDAAALLSSIGDIEQVTQRAFNATNEALIANAKILDTTSAKLVQLRAQIDKLAFETFGEGIKQAATAIIDAITFIVSVLNKIPPAFIAAALQAGVFLVALKLITVISTKIITGLGGMAASLLATAKAFNTATVSAQQFQRVSSSGLVGTNGLPLTGPAAAAGRFGRLGGIRNAAFLGGGAAIGAGISAISGGDPLQILSGALAGGGIAALQAPVPLPWLKVAGAIGLGASVLLDFIPRNKDANESLEETAVKAEKVLNAFQQFKEAQLILDDLTTEQKELAEGISQLQSIENRSAAENGQLLDYQSTYIQNAQAIVDANNQISASMEAIVEVAPELRKAFEAAQRGQLSPDDLEKAIREYQLVLLRLSDPNAQLPENVPFYKPEKLPIEDFSTGKSIVGGGPELKVPIELEFDAPNTAQLEDKIQQAVIGISNEDITIPGEILDLTELEDKAERVKELFSQAGTEFTASLVPSGENVDLIVGALEQLKANGDSSYSTLKKTFDEWLRGKDAVTAFYTNIASYQNRIDAIKVFAPETGAELQKILDLVVLIGKEAIKAGDTDTLFKAQDILYQTLFSGKEFTPEQGKELAGLRADQLGIDDNLIEKGQVVRDILQGMGFDWEFLGEKAKTASGDVDEAIQAQIDRLAELASSVASSNALKSADLQAQFQAGEFKGNEEVYNRQIAQLNAITEGVNRATAAYSEGAQVIPDFDLALQDIAAGLSSVNGLQDAGSLSADQLIQRIFGLAETYGLTEKQTKKLTEKMLGMLGVIQTINGQKATFVIEGQMNLGPLISSLRGAAAIAAKLPFGFGLGISSLFGALAAALSGYQGSQFAGDIKEILSGGTGSNFSRIPSGTSGSGSRTRSPTSSRSTSLSDRYDISEVDVPDAIAQAYNRDALIQEAIRRAKALQSKIPGAAKDAKNDIISVLEGTQKLIEVRGVKDDLLRRALEELAEIEKKRLEFETKADTIRRIRVGAGDFSAIANVPLNTRTGVSLGGAEGPINVSIGLTGQILTPAQMQQLADLIASSIKRQIAA